jgi:hypothetical protein
MASSYISVGCGDGTSTHSFHTDDDRQQLVLIEQRVYPVV